MNYTMKFYESAERFQNKRKAIVDEYDQRMKGLEKHAGSEYHREEAAKATDKRDQALNLLKGEYKDVLYSRLRDMRTANERRGLKPPTDEELRLIQALKLRDNVSEQELRQAALTLKGNESALMIVQEIADRQAREQNEKEGLAVPLHHPENYLKYSDEEAMPIATCEAYIRTLEGGVEDFVEYDTMQSARQAQRYHENLYGTVENGRELTKRPLFDTRSGCFKELCGMSPDELTRFSAAIDGAEA